MVKVKICGITNSEDASMAASLGVHALGFVFAPSPRQVTPEKVRSIIGTLPPFIQTVGVFVNEDLETIWDITDYCGLGILQLHGNETPEFCYRVTLPSIKAFRLKDESSLLSMKLYRGKVRALLLDTYRKGVKGGTGKGFDWNLAIRARELGIPVILSGGLRPSNIQRAISTVKPYAVDVNSGIELHPGKKNHILMKEAIENVRRMNLRGLAHDYSRILR